MPGADADPVAWVDFVTKAKECIIASFDTLVGLVDEDVRRADSQRQLQGWQYLSFFRQKVMRLFAPVRSQLTSNATGQEVLADLFEAMQLWEDALLQYDELEASFFQALKGDESFTSPTKKTN